ncbi:MAG: ABC transporter permease [Acidobacteriota bacterium]|nr:MAG: ABC transporter permease [Acidobacteriota bacterium]
MARLLRRVGVAGATVIGVSLITFIVLDALPGDPLAAYAPPDVTRRLDDAQREALAHELGLDRPLLVRYAEWCGGVLRGDLGRSLRSRRPVAEELARRLIPTLELNLAAFALVLIFGLPLGWWAARRPGTPLERFTSLGLLALYAAPSFWIAMVLQHLFAVRWGLLPLYGRTPPSGPSGPLVRLAHLALPASCLALHGLAFYARLARNTAREGLSSWHALEARTLGVTERRVFFRHALRPSLVALATLLGLVLPAFVSGSVLIESLFGWPGLGRLYVQAVLSRDFPVVLGLTVLTGSLTVAGSLLADMIAGLIDPRWRAGDER